MSASQRLRVVVFVLPLIVTVAAARQVAPHLRAVDFVAVFAAGILFGVSLASLIRALRGGGAPQA